MKQRIFLLLLVLVIACDNKEDEPRAATVGEKHLEEILDLMEANSINRKKIHWPTFKQNARAEAVGAQSINDAYPAIQLALHALDDSHSSYHGTGIVLTAYDKNCQSSASPTGPVTNIGYIRVTGFSGSGDQATAFATAIQTSIKEQDKADLKGWIIDLRGNTGGNMWPMIAGVGPVLGEGVVGYFVDPDNKQSTWSYGAGSSMLDGVKFVTVSPAYTLINSNPKVAVLIDQATISSGEATTVAFYGRANTKMFGVATCGLSTANSTYKLSDGSLLVLTISYMTDRNKILTGIAIVPDETVQGDKQVLAKAVEWLNQ